MDIACARGKLRRPRGAGGVEKTPDGRFRARFAFDGVKREAIEGSPFATSDEAARALDGLLELLKAAPVGGMTLRRLGELTLARRDREGYRSVDGDRYTWDRHVVTWELAGLPASQIKRSDIRELIANLRHHKTGKSLATQTRRNVLNIVRSVFAHGCDLELIETNPCRDLKVKATPGTRETSTFLTLDEANALIGAATDPAVALAIGTGLRSGELRSLEWVDVHLDDAEPHIVVRYGSPSKPTKNGRIRHVPLFGVALATLSAMTSEAAHGIVLPTPTGWYRRRGRVVEPADWKAWKRAARITRPVRWHDLRHTCATLLLSGAWDRPWSYEEVKEMLGHSSVKVTERYAHAVGTLAGNAAKAMREAERKPIVSPPEAEPEVVQAREIIERCGWDLNPHMSVLQTRHRPPKYRNNGGELGRLWAYEEERAELLELWRAFLTEVAEGRQTALARGLAFAEAWAKAEAEAQRLAVGAAR